jgi:serine protease Do
MSRIRWYGPSVVLFLTLVAVMVAGPEAARTIATAQQEAGNNQLRKQLEDSPALSQLSDAFKKVAKVVEPSVVHIKILSRQEGAEQRLPDDMLRRFFGPEFEERFERRQREGQGQNFDQYNAPQERGNGSGWVYDKEGHIITNHHVAAAADEIRVRFHDGTEREAEVVGTDPQTDVAVLKVDHDNLQPLAIADNGISQGEMVFAFGSPFGFEFSMSQGIVSAKGRQLGIIRNYDEDTGQVTAGYENFIQTDAAINRGNSGGPLTNVYGQLVGMNTAIASNTGSYNGIGFAIPTAMVTDVVDEIIESPENRVSRGYLGVYIDDLTEEMAKSFDYDSTQGVLVVDPIPNSPADKAGLKAGDIITHINGKKVTNADALRYTVASVDPGQEVELKVVREGETQDVTVTLGRLDDRAASAEGGQAEDEGAIDQQAKGTTVLRKLGIEGVATFTERIARQLDIAHQPGVILQRVRPNSIAAAKGLQRGMIITQVMDTQVQSARDLIKAIEGHDATKPMRFRLLQWNPQRDAFMSRFMALSLPSSN